MQSTVKYADLPINEFFAYAESFETIEDYEGNYFGKTFSVITIGKNL